MTCKAVSRCAVEESSVLGEICREVQHMSAYRTQVTYGRHTRGLVHPLPIADGPETITRRGISNTYSEPKKRYQLALKNYTHVHLIPIPPVNYPTPLHCCSHRCHASQLPMPITPRCRRNATNTIERYLCSREREREVGVSAIWNTRNDLYPERGQRGKGMPMN